MAVNTAAGSVIRIGTNAALPSGDTFNDIGEVTNIPEFGTLYQTVTHNPIGTRETQKFKGSFDSGSLTVEMGRDVADAGQAALVAALATDDLYNIQVELNDGALTNTIFDFKARVMSFRNNVGSVDSIVSATVVLEISGTITETAAT